MPDCKKERKFQVNKSHLQCKCHNISSSAFTWFESYLHQRTQAVCYSRETSLSVSLGYSDLQGSVLGLLLFHLYISDTSRIAKVHTFLNQCYADSQLYCHLKPGETTAQIAFSGVLMRFMSSLPEKNKLRLTLIK